MQLRRPSFGGRDLARAIWSVFGSSCTDFGPMCSGCKHRVNFSDYAVRVYWECNTANLYFSAQAIHAPTSKHLGGVSGHCDYTFLVDTALDHFISKSANPVGMVTPRGSARKSRYNSYFRSEINVNTINIDIILIVVWSTQFA